jgi:hypothetical protein
MKVQLRPLAHQRLFGFSDEDLIYLFELKTTNWLSFSGRR